MNSMQYGSTSPIENNIENITGSEPGNMEKDIVNNYGPVSPRVA